MTSQVGLGQVMNFVQAVNSTNILLEQPQYKKFVEKIITKYQNSSKGNYLYEDMINDFRQLGYNPDVDFVNSTSQLQEIYNEKPSAVITLFDSYCKKIAKKEYENSIWYSILNDADAFVISLVMLTLATIVVVSIVNTIFFNHNSDGIVLAKYGETYHEDTMPSAQMKYFAEFKVIKDADEYVDTSPIGGKIEVFTSKPSKGILKCYRNESESLPSVFLNYETKLVTSKQSIASLTIPPGIKKIVIEPDR